MIKVEYIDHMGDDNRVVNAARVSFSKEASNYSEDQNSRLLKYLAKHDHFTPFTHPQITFRESAPIFVVAQRMKHQIGFTYNSVSRRYVDDAPEFYYPDQWRVRPDGSVKQGSGEDSVEVLRHCDKEFKDMYTHRAYEEVVDNCKVLYESMLKNGIAPEMARMVLPQSMMTSYYVTGSLAAFARAYKQRIDNHSQKEIQILAEQWDEIIRPLYPESWKALVD